MEKEEKRNERMKSKQFALLAGAMMVPAVITPAAAAANWTQFQGNVWNTGVTPDPGPGLVRLGFNNLCGDNLHINLLF
jgi:hypothetical protein